MSRVGGTVVLKLSRDKIGPESYWSGESSLRFSPKSGERFSP